MTATPAEQRHSQALALPYLRRAVALAEQGLRWDPNPRVGCVIVSSAGDMIGEGFHRGAGTAHAEVSALTAAQEAGCRTDGATAYVTLEPCVHIGRTAPCAQALRSAGVAEVVYAVADPSREAAGGAAWLASEGVRVRRQDLLEASELVADWAWAARHGRPRVIWKIASTLDGRVAAIDGTSKWITSAASRADAHQLRARVGAIMVGTGTALADDPALTARVSTGATGKVAGVQQPVPVVVGHRELPASARLRHGPVAPLLLHTHDPHQVAAELHTRGLHTVLLEGGPQLAGAFWRAGLVDEIRVYLAAALLGAGAAAVPDLGIRTIADIARLELAEVERIGPDVRLRLVPGQEN